MEKGEIEAVGVKVGVEAEAEAQVEGRGSNGIRILMNPAPVVAASIVALVLIAVLALPPQIVTGIVVAVNVPAQDPTALLGGLHQEGVHNQGRMILRIVLCLQSYQPPHIQTHHL